MHEDCVVEVSVFVRPSNPAPGRLGLYTARTQIFPFSLQDFGIICLDISGKFHCERLL